MIARTTKRILLMAVLILGCVMPVNTQAKGFLNQLGNAFNQALQQNIKAQEIVTYGESCADYQNFMAFYNKGVSEYQNEEYEYALYHFKEARKIGLNSTNQYFKEYYKLYLKEGIESCISTADTAFKLENPQAASQQAAAAQTQQSVSAGAAAGGTYQSTTAHPVNCSWCYGTGTCGTCNGKGISHKGSRYACGACNGTGRCAGCGGAGIKGYEYY